MHVHMSIAELLVAYAVGDAANYMAYGQQKGMVSVDLITGKATEVGSAAQQHVQSQLVQSA